MKEETPAPPTPSLDCVHLKEHILRLQWISPLNKSCTSNLGYQDYRKRHKQTGCTKNSAEASFFFLSFFVFHKTNPSKVSSGLHVLAEAPTRRHSLYLQASGALAGTSDYKSHPNSCRSRCVESSWRYRRYRCVCCECGKWDAHFVLNVI